MVKVGRRPGRLTMANGAICRELRCFVVRAARLVEVIKVTTNTGIGGIVIIAVVTSDTIIGYRRMGPI